MHQPTTNVNTNEAIQGSGNVRTAVIRGDLRGLGRNNFSTFHTILVRVAVAVMSADEGESADQVFGQANDLLSNDRFLKQLLSKQSTRAQDLAAELINPSKQSWFGMMELFCEIRLLSQIKTVFIILSECMSLWKSKPILLNLVAAVALTCIAIPFIVVANVLFRPMFIVSRAASQVFGWSSQDEITESQNVADVPPVTEHQMVPYVPQVTELDPYVRLVTELVRYVRPVTELVRYVRPVTERQMVAYVRPVTERQMVAYVRPVTERQMVRYVPPVTERRFVPQVLFRPMFVASQPFREAAISLFGWSQQDKITERQMVPYVQPVSVDQPVCEENLSVLLRSSAAVSQIERKPLFNLSKIFSLLSAAIVLILLATRVSHMDQLTSPKPSKDTKQPMEQPSNGISRVRGLFAAQQTVRQPSNHLRRQPSNHLSLPGIF